MATSGSVAWNLDVASIIEQAYKRARPEAGEMSALNAKDARTALNFVLTDLSNAGHALSSLEFKTLSLTQGTINYTLPTDVIDIFDITYAKYLGAGMNPEWEETALTRIDLASYNQINDKTIQSYLSQYALHRGVNAATMYLYPTCTNDDDELRYWALTRNEDVTASYQDVNLSYRYTNTLTAGAAYYIALAAPENTEMYEPRLARLKQNYVEAMELAFGEDRDRSSMYVYPQMTRRFR